MAYSHPIKKIFENIGEGFFSKKKTTPSNKFEISKDDPVDVIFAKKLNNSGGKFFYCNNKEKIKKTLGKFLNHLEIEKLYCVDKNIQQILTSLNLNFEINNFEKCQGIISTCEYIIADQGKVLLSSEQIKNNKLSNFPNELIIISYTSQIVKRINDAMRALTKKYKYKTPSNISTIGNGIKNLNVIIIEDFKS